MSIKDDVVRYVARLARIKLNEKEAQLFCRQLDEILGYVDKLKKLDIKDIPPTSHVLPLKNVYREDEVKPSISNEMALKNAPQRKGDFFKVPKIIEVENPSATKIGGRPPKIFGGRLKRKA